MPLVHANRFTFLKQPFALLVSWYDFHFSVEHRDFGNAFSIDLDSKGSAQIHDIGCGSADLKAFGTGRNRCRQKPRVQTSLSRPDQFITSWPLQCDFHSIIKL